MPSRIETGLNELDRRLDGGVRPETLATIISPPNSQCNVLLREMAENRRTLFISTLLEEETLASMFDDKLVKTGQIVPHYTGIENRTKEVLKALQKVEEEQEDALIILHGIDIIENSLEEDKYIQFVNEVRQTLRDTGGVALFSGTQGRSVCGARDLTYELSDLVLELEMERNMDDLETRLMIPKYRGGKALTETIKIELTDELLIDTSRDIA